MVDLVAPVSEHAETRRGGPSPGIGLAISGGGYRAMLFHLGAFLRLFELGLLQQLTRISSVSGGSITSAKVALEWGRLTSRDDFFEHVVAPIRRLASSTIDWPCVAAGILLPGDVAHYISFAYRRFLFGDAMLSDLPASPEFVINATNMETGTLWRITRASMADWKVGTINKPRLFLSDAVAASSAFPPVLSPYVLKVKPSDFSGGKVDPALRSNISLADGGVYDNLGLETVWKAFENVLVSDAGAALDPDPSPSADWLSQSRRSIDVIYSQVGSLRKRQLIASYKAKKGQPGARKGTYWGIGSDVAHYKLPSALPAPHDRTLPLAQISTRLKRLPPEVQERLINWGYAICDTALRKHFRQPNEPTATFPYPRGL
jgi:NTE family protein